MPSTFFDRILRPLRRGTVTSPTRTPHRTCRGRPRPAGAHGSPGATRRAACVDACPTGAIRVSGSTWSLDAGACILCGRCALACPRDAIRMGDRIELAVLDRDGLVVAHALRRTP